MDSSGSADERVRAVLSGLGSDPASAPAVPPAVTAQVVSALRGARPRRRAVRVSALVGATAGVAAAALGTAMLVGSHGSAPGRPQVDHLSSEPPAVIPLSDSQLAALLGRAPDLGPLADPRRRSSCLGGLGYPGSVDELGGAQVEIRGAPAVVLLLPGDTADVVAVLAVRPNCSAADTGLVADTSIRRP